MRKGLLSDVSIRAHCPEMFKLDFKLHQQLFADDAHVPTHGMPGIRAPKTSHRHIKARPRLPIYDLFTNAQAYQPLNPSVLDVVTAYRRAVQLSGQTQAGRRRGREDEYAERLFQHFNPDNDEYIIEPDATRRRTGELGEPGSPRMWVSTWR